jgi:uncharacterized membrane protein YecN with MAPEG domain
MNMNTKYKVMLVVSIAGWIIFVSGLSLIFGSLIVASSNLDKGIYPPTNFTFIGMIYTLFTIIGASIACIFSSLTWELYDEKR